ncbi:putative baseplate assembly protein [Chitinimonas sp.]|uniref:putative baseplate assembly protein n=1 Tax=Chitinimonas sp. TaxID=1934313 RepID=UPI002F937B61
MSYACERDGRREAVRQKPGLNGLDYLEVADDQLSLQVYFLGSLPAALRVPKRGDIPWLQIAGGQRINGIRITAIEPVVAADPDRDDSLIVHLDRYGDFSLYTLRLVGLEQIDPRYDRLAFSFKVNCPSDLDCVPACDCVEAPPAEPEINYLAKDYQSFRSLILDRLAVLMPNWQERHATDVGITLVELMAYVGDYLSYYQDAVATEAYLDTARLRISVRRHTRLVDYRLHEGCNARAWVCLCSTGDFTLEKGSAFVTRLQDERAADKVVVNTGLLAALPKSDYEVFESMTPLAVRAAHSRIRFHTWGGQLCCLERGSTSATLIDAYPETKGGAGEVANHRGEEAVTGQSGLQLQAGDVLVLEEVIGPRTGEIADADPARRHVVRLTRVTPGQDELVRDQQGRPTRLLEVEWGKVDALPFTLCLSAMGPPPLCRYLEDVSVACGNVVLVDHGHTQPPEGWEDLGVVPTEHTSAVCDCIATPGETSTEAGDFRPALARTGLVFSQPLAVDDPAAGEWQPAARRGDQDVRLALPQLWLLSSTPGQATLSWQPVHDLLACGPEDRQFVVEIDDDRVAHLRFGDGELGCAPQAGSRYAARYRVGGGKAGNVGAGAICHLLRDGPAATAGLQSIRNPLPARGGTEPEPLAEAKLYAPHRFRKQLERAITPADYQALAMQAGGIQRAAAAFRWTGSWYEADVALDPEGSETLTADQQHAMTTRLEAYRRIGHDLAVNQADYVPLRLKLHACAMPHTPRGEVRAALLAAFSNRLLAGGKLGYFHPDRLSFGEPVTVSGIVAAAMAVAGVQDASVLVLQRQFEAPNHELEQGFLALRSGEIARLDNDPNYPEHGVIEIIVDGGR